MSECSYCGRNIENKGSLKSHELVCDNNPDKIIRKRSSMAGKQKGHPAWNKGMTFDNSDKIIKKISSGEYLKYREAHIRRMAKTYLIITLGHKCHICDTSEWCGAPVPIVCDHIDGDHTNNNIDNFRLVCANCDAQLPTYKSKNKGRGRSYDREYKRPKNLEKLAELV